MEESKSTARLREPDSARVENTVAMLLQSDLVYIEQTIKRLVESLKRDGYLDPDFQFLTKAERERALNEFMEKVIRTEAHLYRNKLDHQATRSWKP